MNAHLLVLAAGERPTCGRSRMTRWSDFHKIFAHDDAATEGLTRRVNPHLIGDCGVTSWHKMGEH